MRWLPQLMWNFPSLSRSRTSRLSMTDIVTSNSSNIFRLLLHLAGLDELVEPFLCQYQCHQVLFHGIPVGHEMDVLQFLGVQADEAEVELLILGMFHCRDSRMTSLQGMFTELLRLC